MKIALLSPFYSQNYGTVLQAFALAKVIKDLGIDCEYLNWRRCPPSLFSQLLFFIKHPTFAYFLFKKRRLKSKDLNYSFLSEPDYQTILSKNKKFVDRYTPFTDKMYYLDTFKYSSNLYDKFIVGSDQTWSTQDIYRFSPYYLDFLKENKKKNAYACSIGTNVLPSSYLNYISKRLKNFSRVSCREQGNSKILSDSTGRCVKNVVDPTLLINGDQWKECFQPMNITEKYILCYRLGERSCVNEYAEYLSRKKKLPVYYIETRPTSNNSKNVLHGIGVQEFLWLIMNSSYMVTDSYHGTIFSLNFNREVFAFDKFDKKFEKTSDNGRIFDLLLSYGIENHFFNDYDEIIPNKIDFLRVNNLLENNRNESLDFLKSVIYK